MKRETTETVPTGYEALIQAFHLKVIPHWCSSFIAFKGGRRVYEEGGRRIIHYPKGYFPGDAVSDHLEFALKYDGINLQILSLVFQSWSEKELETYILKNPTGKYARTLWFLYEFLTGKSLDLKDVTIGSYVNVLDPDQYFHSNPIISQRHRVRDNLLGDAAFCPIIRRTRKLEEYIQKNLPLEAQKILQAFSETDIQRAVQYLYTKETLSSYRIEREKPDQKKAARFAALLKTSNHFDFLTKKALISLQNDTVDPRFKENDYRHDQNYVGETQLDREIVHYVSPKPEDLESLMQGLFQCHNRMKEARLHPVIMATAISFGFVFLHPFGDGNGRLHRFLIHHLLAKEKFTPAGFIFPVSAVMLSDLRAYDQCLEQFSKPLLECVDYDLDKLGKMSVLHSTRVYYQSTDMTAMAEYLFQCIERTIEKDFMEELNFISRYDQAKNSLREIVDMPDRLMDLFIKITRQNKGALSKEKRKSHFKMLTAEELAKMERVIQTIFFES